jgi:3alpha(or 20beta)-hydroxysteroid dehydrogenase
MSSSLLDGKSVVITGAARGLGAAIAARCVAHGARVVVADVLEAELDRTAAELGSAVSACHLDVTDPTSWRRLADLCRDDFGRPDGLVNNAGIVRPASLQDATYAELQRTLEVNVGGTFLGTKWYLDIHVATSCDRPGSIVNISSVRGLIGGARTVTYAASKFGVRGITKAAAVELGPLGIRVNSVCPGPIESDMSVGNADFAGLDWQAYAAKLPLGRMGRPLDIGEAVVWLTSDASAFVTGVDLPVDGGLTATSHGITESSLSPEPGGSAEVHQAR